MNDSTGLLVVKIAHCLFFMAMACATVAISFFIITAAVEDVEILFALVGSAIWIFFPILAVLAAPCICRYVQRLRHVALEPQNLRTPLVPSEAHYRN